MTQEGKNVGSIVVFTKQFKALAGWRRALMNEGINALFSTCHRLFPIAASPTCLEPPGLQGMKIAGRLLQIVHPTTMPFDANAQSSFYALKVGPPHNPPRRLDRGFGARTTIARASRYNGQHHQT
jgi:hypothetical protein